MKDFFGTELAVGDIVAQAYTGYNALHLAKIHSIGKSSVVTYPLTEKGIDLNHRRVRDPNSLIKKPDGI
jgi:hypothetical protein